MGANFWILISVLGVVLLLFAFWIFVRKGRQRPADYYAWFWIGLIWLVLGLPLKNYALSIVGAVFLILGLVNRDKWKTNRVRWSDLDKSEKRLKIIAIIVLFVLVILGLVVYYLTEKGYY